MPAFNLEDQIAFYGAYHHNKTNIVIHTVCVPLILVTTFLLLSGAGPSTTVMAPVTELLGSVIPDRYVNLGVLLSTAYAALYIALDPPLGTVLAPLLIWSAFATTDVVATHGLKAYYVAAGVWVASWILQFYGHGVHEKRAPALLDNLFQAVFLAPLFVTLEVLFMLGLRPDLERRVESRVRSKLEELKRGA
ncbi:uncharacterized protein V1510DRAFT_414215 [Dipodascopsis tothii]|uniref:uncharacterized protein n=1 Tax=Dipodascopsis tothii TaxID=44089 RepID=UPI0034D0062C